MVVVYWYKSGAMSVFLGAGVVVLVAGAITLVCGKGCTGCGTGVEKVVAACCKGAAGKMSCGGTMACGTPC